MGDIPFLPGPLQYFSYLAATSWPPGSETAMFGIGDARHRSAEELDELRPQLKTVREEIPSVLLGEAADAAEQQLAALDDALAALVEAEAALGDLAESFGNTLQDTKIEIWVGVAAAAAEITWALAMHGPTAGASLAWIPVIEAMTVAALRKLVLQAVLRVVAMLKNAKTLLLAALREGHEELYWGVGEWLTTVGLQHLLLGHNNFDAEVLALTAVASGAGGAGGGAAVGPTSALMGPAASKVGAAGKGVTTLFTVGVVGNVTGSLAVGAPLDEFPIVASALSSSITGLRGDGVQPGAATTTSTSPATIGPPGTGLPSLDASPPGAPAGVVSSEGGRRPFRQQWKPDGPQHGWRVGAPIASVNSASGTRLSHSAGVADLQTAPGATKGVALHADPADPESLLDSPQQSATSEAAHKDPSEPPLVDAKSSESVSKASQQPTNGDAPQKDPALKLIGERAESSPPADVPLSIDADAESGIDAATDPPTAAPTVGPSNHGSASGPGPSPVSRPAPTPRSPAAPSRQAAKSRPGGRTSKHAVRQERLARPSEGRSSSPPAGLPTTHLSATAAEQQQGAEQLDRTEQPAAEHPDLFAADEIGLAAGHPDDPDYERQRNYRREYKEYLLENKAGIPRRVDASLAAPLDAVVDAANPLLTREFAEDLSGMYDGLYSVELHDETHRYGQTYGEEGIVLAGFILDGRRIVGSVGWEFRGDPKGRLTTHLDLQIDDKDFPGAAFYNSLISTMAPYLRAHGIDHVTLTTRGWGVRAAVHADEIWNPDLQLRRESAITIRESARQLMHSRELSDEAENVLRQLEQLDPERALDPEHPDRLPEPIGLKTLGLKKYETSDERDLGSRLLEGAASAGGAVHLIKPLPHWNPRSDSQNCVLGSAEKLSTRYPDREFPLDAEPSEEGVPAKAIYKAANSAAEFVVDYSDLAEKKVVHWYDQVKAMLEELGEGSAAILASKWTREGWPGHVYLAVNDGGTIYLEDSFTGERSPWPPFFKEDVALTTVGYLDSHGRAVKSLHDADVDGACPESRGIWVTIHDEL